MNRRQLLVLAGGVGTAVTVACAAAPVGEGRVSLPDFRREGDRDDSEALSRALALGKAVRLPAGKGSGPKGAYIFESVPVGAGADIAGDGPSTIVRRRSAQTRSLFAAHSDAPDRPVQNLRFQDFRVEGQFPGQGFREHFNLFDLTGVEDVAIERIEVHGFPGDAICFGGDENRPGRKFEVRHNRGLLVRDCSFDGIDRRNRNAISVVDGTDVRIEKCLFENCAQDGMPGAIDFEPNPYALGYRLQNIVVRNCTFRRCGGSNGAISVYVPDEAKMLPVGLDISGNVFERNLTADVYINIRPTRSMAGASRIRMQSNRGTAGSTPWKIFAARDVTIDSSNSWSDYAGAAILGYSDPGDGVEDMDHAAHYTRVGTGGRAAPFGVAVFNLVRGRIGGSFVDCGDGSADAAALAFFGKASRDVQVTGIRISSPRRKTRRALRVLSPEAGRVIRFSGSDIGGLPSDL